MPSVFCYKEVITTVNSFQNCSFKIVAH